MEELYFTLKALKLVTAVEESSINDIKN